MQIAKIALMFSASHAAHDLRQVTTYQTPIPTVAITGRCRTQARVLGPFDACREQFFGPLGTVGTVSTSSPPLPHNATGACRPTNRLDNYEVKAKEDAPAHLHSFRPPPQQCAYARLLPTWDISARALLLSYAPDTTSTSTNAHLNAHTDVYQPRPGAGRRVRLRGKSKPEP